MIGVGRKYVGCPQQFKIHLRRRLRITHNAKFMLSKAETLGHSLGITKPNKFRACLNLRPCLQVRVMMFL